MYHSPRINRRAALAVAIAALLLGVGHASAAPVTYRDLQVEVVGAGRPVLMIPGLNSSADTWRETCAALQADHVQCHLLQLPGFAGLAPIKTEAFLADMRDRVLAYVKDRQLESPVVMGHSLGGELALQMALKEPNAFERLIIVDSLPFFPAAQNPAMTEASARPMADGMRQGMLAADDATYAAQTAAAVQGMTLSPARVKTLQKWGAASDRATSTLAMYELMTIDLRPKLDAIKTPTLVLGAWAAYAKYGATRASTEAIFTDQYAKLDGVRIELSEAGYHFLMWDDPRWLQQQVREFLAADGDNLAKD